MSVPIPCVLSLTHIPSLYSPLISFTGLSDKGIFFPFLIDDGDLYKAQIVGIQKGSSGSPGELSGLIHYEAEKIIGSKEKNCEQGIYGRLSELPEELGLRKMEVAYKQELEIGPASILCCVDGTVREFDAEKQELT